MKKLILIIALFLSFGISNAQSNFFWSYPNTDGTGFGAMYNGYAISNANFAPSGWHVATESDWQTLSSTLGGDSGAGAKLKKQGVVFWNYPNTSATNEYGFSAVGSGYRNYITGVFYDLKAYGGIFTSTATDANNKRVITIDTGNSINSTTSTGNNKIGLAVRLIKDDSTDPGTLTDYDGNVYNTMTIGSQVWIASNWKCTHLNDGTAISNVTDNAAWSALTTGAYCWYNNNISYK